MHSPTPRLALVPTPSDKILVSGPTGTPVQALQDMQIRHLGVVGQQCHSASVQAPRPQKRAIFFLPGSQTKIQPICGAIFLFTGFLRGELSPQRNSVFQCGGENLNGSTDCGCQGVSMWLRYGKKSPFFFEPSVCLLVGGSGIKCGWGRNLWT